MDHREALKQSVLFGAMPNELIARVMRFACGVQGRKHFIRKQLNDEDQVLAIDYKNNEQNNLAKVCELFKSIATGLYDFEFDTVDIIADGIDYPNSKESVKFDKEWAYKGCHIGTLSLSNVPSRIYRSCYGQFTVDHVIFKECHLKTVFEKFAILAAFNSWNVKSITYVRNDIELSSEAANQFKHMFMDHGFQNWSVDYHQNDHSIVNQIKSTREEVDVDPIFRIQRSSRLKKILGDVLRLAKDDVTSVSDKSFWMRFDEQENIILNLPRHFFDRLKSAFNATSEQCIDIILEKLKVEVERNCGHCRTVEIADCTPEHLKAVLDVCGGKLSSVNLVEAEPWVLEREIQTLSVQHMVHDNPEKAINKVCKEWAYAAAEVNKWSIGFDRHLALGLILERVPNIEDEGMNKNSIVRDKGRMFLDVRGSHIVLEVKATNRLLSEHNSIKQMENESFDDEFNCYQDDEEGMDYSEEEYEEDSDEVIDIDTD